MGNLLLDADLGAAADEMDLKSAHQSPDSEKTGY